LHNQGYLAQRRGDQHRAAELFHQSLRIFQDLGDQRGVAECVMGLAGVAAAVGQAECAAQLFGAAEAKLASLGVVVSASNLPDYRRNVARARAQLEETVFAAAWADGRALPLEAAIAEAHQLVAEVVGTTG